MEELNDDCLREILLYLPNDTLAKLARTSKAIFRAVIPVLYAAPLDNDQQPMTYFFGPSQKRVQLEYMLMVLAGFPIEIENHRALGLTQIQLPTMTNYYNHVGQMPCLSEVLRIQYQNRSTAKRTTTGSATTTTTTTTAVVAPTENITTPGSSSIATPSASSSSPSTTATTTTTTTPQTPPRRGPPPHMEQQWAYRRFFASKIRTLKLVVPEPLTTCLEALPLFSRLHTIHFMRNDLGPTPLTNSILLEPTRQDKDEVQDQVRTILDRHRELFPSILKSADLKDMSDREGPEDIEMQKVIYEAMGNRWTKDTLSLTYPDEQDETFLWLLRDEELPTRLRNLSFKYDYYIAEATAANNTLSASSGSSNGLLPIREYPFSTFLSRCRVMKKVDIATCGPNTLSWATREREQYDLNPASVQQPLAQWKELVLTSDYRLRNQPHNKAMFLDALKGFRHCLESLDCDGMLFMGQSELHAGNANGGGGGGGGAGGNGGDIAAIGGGGAEAGQENFGLQAVAAAATAAVTAAAANTTMELGQQPPVLPILTHSMNEPTVGPYELPKLRTLDLDFSYLKYISLQGCSNLRKLVLHGDSRIGLHRNPTGQKWQAPKHLETLRLVGDPANQFDFNSLGLMKSLKVLDVSIFKDEWPPEEELVQIDPSWYLPNMVALSLRGVAASQIQLQLLPICPNLQEVTLSSLWGEELEVINLDLSGLVSTTATDNTGLSTVSSMEDNNCKSHPMVYSKLKSVHIGMDFRMDSQCLGLLLNVWPTDLDGSEDLEANMGGKRTRLAMFPSVSDIAVESLPEDDEECERILEIFRHVCHRGHHSSPSPLQSNNSKSQEQQQQPLRIHLHLEDDDEKESEWIRMLQEPRMGLESVPEFALSPTDAVICVRNEYFRAIATRKEEEATLEKDSVEIEMTVVP